MRRVQLEEEQERSRLMEESLHALASEHHALEQSLGGPVVSGDMIKTKQFFIDFPLLTPGLVLEVVFV